MLKETVEQTETIVAMDLPLPPPPPEDEWDPNPEPTNMNGTVYTQDSMDLCFLFVILRYFFT